MSVPRALIFLPRSNRCDRRRRPCGSVRIGSWRRPSSIGTGVTTAPWMPVEDFDRCSAAVGRIGLPAILKTTRLGYDGKGQAMLRRAWRLATSIRSFVAEATDPGGFHRFRAGDQRGRRARRGRRLCGLRYRGEPPPQPYPRPHPRAGTHRAIGRSAGAGDRAADRRCAGSGRIARGGDVRRSRRPRAGQRDRAAPAQFRPLDDRCLPRQPVRTAYPRHRRPAAAAGRAPLGRGDEEPCGSAGGRALASNPRYAGVDPAPLWQGRGATRAEDGARHAAVSPGLAAGRVRDRSGARAGCAARGGGGSVPGPVERTTPRPRSRSVRRRRGRSSAAPAGISSTTRTPPESRIPASIIRLSNRPNCSISRPSASRRNPSALVVARPHGRRQNPACVA